MNHTMEQYFTADTTLLNDGICEANLRSLMENTKTILENPEDYRTRIITRKNLIDIDNSTLFLPHN